MGSGCGDVTGERCRLDNAENSRNEHASRRRGSEASDDCIVLLDETSRDPLKRRLDTSSLLLSSFADAGASSSKYVSPITP